MSMKSGRRHGGRTLEVFIVDQHVSYVEERSNWSSTVHTAGWSTANDGSVRAGGEGSDECSIILACAVVAVH